MKIWRTIWLCLLLANSLLLAWADVIPDGRRGINYCFRIGNIDQYPKYVFISYVSFPTPGYRLIKQGECVQFYHLSQPNIYAIEKTKFSEDSIKYDRFANQEESRQRLVRYFEANPNMLRSEIKIRSVSTRDKLDPVKSIEDVLMIKSISAKSLNLAYQSVTYTFDDGATEKKAYTIQNQRPEPSRKALKAKSASSILPDTMWLIAGSLSVLGLFVSRYMRNRTN